MTGFFKYFGLCAVLFAVHVSGIDFSFSIKEVLLGSTGTQTLACQVNEDDAELIYSIKMLRETNPGSSIMEPFAEIDAVRAPNPTLTKQIPGFVVGGVLDQENRRNTKLEVSMEVEKLTCSDVREYQCQLSYLQSITGLTKTPKSNATFSGYVYPEIRQLDGKRNGNPVQGLSASDPAAFGVGDVLELSCTANIGSKPETIIRWQKTSEMTNGFIGYQPEAGTFDEGTAISDNQCGYTRVAKITYNTTASDAAMSNNLAFECYVSVSGGPYGTTYKTQKSFFAKVDGGDETPSTGTATAGSGDAGIIAGSVVGGLVLIVIIVLLVYFLWYRRRNSGEDYTTKEEYGSENPNMAPPVDTYASVDKHRNRGHENRGLDEPHETRRHHYENGPGRSNHAMDRDADDYDYDSRDGSPTRSNQGINHMGMDPHSGIGTGV